MIYTLDIFSDVGNFFGGIIDFISYIVNSLGDVIAFLLELFQFIFSLVTFLPSPFNEITIAFLGINTILFINKVRSGS